MGDTTCRRAPSIILSGWLVLKGLKVTSLLRYFSFRDVSDSRGSFTLSALEKLSGGACSDVPKLGSEFPRAWSGEGNN
jgi:hypothetical protein